MAEKLTQRGRFCTVTTPLGEDDLIVQRFTGSEAISQLFQFEIDFVSEKPEIDFQNIVGKKIGIHVELKQKQHRHFHGFVSRFGQGPIEGSYYTYRAHVVPWLWFLTRNADCRIFQDKPVPKIVEEIFEERGFLDFKGKPEGAERPRKYCVQYRETDLNFVARILEEEGISYYFEHEKDRHVLVLANTPTGFAKCPIQSQLEYASVRGAEQMAGEVEDWVRERELHPGTYAVGDWNFETPKEPVVASALTQEKNQKKGYARFEIFDYPTEHSNLDEGNARAKLRMEIEEAAAVRSFGRTSCATLTAGHRFELKGHYRKGYDREYLLTSVQHSITQGVGFGADEGGSYSNSFTCIPHSVVFRPPLLTPKPVIQGVQTAVVVGKGEIDVDKYGRVALKFHWDRSKTRDDTSSCRIRVSQPFAGTAFGGAFWPRIGQEVIVSFEEGDPDRPLITGRVYNAEQMPPYTPVGDKKTQSGIRTRSSEKGSPDNFNEIRFEDKKGEEHIFLHAEKDQHNHVKDGAFEYVGGEHHRTVKKDDYLDLAMNHHRTVATDVYDDVGGSLHQSVGMERHTKIGMVEAVESGQEIHLKGGMNVVIEAGMQLTLKGAGGFIVIDPSGVSIQGMLVKINSGGAAGSGAGAKPKKPKKPKEAKKS